MTQHLDYLAAHSVAREREHDLQRDLRHREAVAARPQTPTAGAESHHWFHDALVHLHIVHAPTP